MKNEIILGDCLEVIQQIPNDCIDLVVTSPPYALQRKDFYSSIDENKYPEWTVQWMEKCIRVLKKTGSIAIVIRPHINQGQISDYVLKTRLAIRAAGWCECEELIWIKPNAPPLGSLKRPRRAWESILWFSRTPYPFCEPKANGRFSKKIRCHSKKGLGEYIRPQAKCLPKEGIARCCDYVETTGGKDRSKESTHPAQYPKDLASWIIKLLSPDQGIVLDPFIGGGTTAIAAIECNRSYIGIELMEEYYDYARKRIDNFKSLLNKV